MTIQKLIAGVLITSLGLQLSASGQQVPPPSTAYTRALLRSTNAAEARSVLGVLSTNATAVLTPDGTTIVTNANGTMTSLTTSNQPPFTIVLIPDSQIIMSGGGGVTPGNPNTNRWDQTVNWVQTNAANLNIAAVIGLGDCVDTATNVQLQAYTNSFRLLTSVPFITPPGNHDCDVNGNGVYSIFNSYVTRGYYTNRTWWSATRGGFYTNGQQDLYITVTNGTTKLLIIGLEYGPQIGMVNWASNVAASYPDHYVILETHSYLHNDGTRMTPSDQFDPSGPGMLDGDAMWNQSLKYWPNLRAVVCGHQICSPFEARQTSIGSYGNWVNEIFVNYQCDSDGGGPSSMLGILTFDPNKGTIDATTFDAGQLSYTATNWTAPMRASGLLRISSAATNATSTATNVSPLATLDRDLIFRVTFDEGSGDTLHDLGPYRLLGNGYTNIAGGTGFPETNWLGIASALQGAGAFEFHTNVFQFTNGDDGVFSLLTNGGFTFSAWVASTNWAGVPNRYIGGRYGSGGTDGSFYVAIKDAGKAFRIRLVNSSPATTDFRCNTATFGDTNWHQIAATWSGSNLVAYVDGNADGTASFAGPMNFSAGHDFVFGNYAVIGNGWLEGVRLDDVRVWDRALSADEVADLYRSRGAGGTTNINNYNTTTITTNQPSAMNSLERGLIFYAPLDESASDVVHDVGPYRLIGQGVTNAFGLDNTNWLSPSSAFAGAAAYEFRTNCFDFGAAADTALGTITSNLTVAFWLASTNWSGMASSRVLLGRFLGGTTGSLLARAKDAGKLFEFTLVNNTPTRVDLDCNTAAPTDGDWHFCAATWDGITLRLYTDGAADGSINFSGTLSLPAGETFVLGNYATNGNAPADMARLDEVRVWNRTLSASEIAALYGSGLAQIGITTNVLASTGISTNQLQFRNGILRAVVPQ